MMTLADIIAAVWHRPAQDISALYARLQSGSLRPGDVIPLADARFDDFGACATLVRGSAAELDKVLPGFRAAYDVFGVFSGDDVVLDVGAHWGYSVAAMRHQGCRSRIISIEAIAANGAGLDALKRLENGRYDWINVAADAGEGTLRLYIPVINGTAVTGLSSTGGTLDARGAAFAAGMTATYRPGRLRVRHRFKLAAADVRAARLDTLLAERGVAEKVVAVKMDIEGHEGPALRGASALLSRQKPLLMIEGANRNAAVTSLLAGHGYFHCERHDGRLVPHAACSSALDGFFIHPSRVAGYRELGIF